MVEHTELKKIVQKCSVSAGLFEQHGCHDVMTAFNIANHLHMHGFLEESAIFYQEAINYRRLAPEGHPREELLLQVKLLCLIKAKKDLEDRDLNRLQEISNSLYQYITAVHAYSRQELNVVDALKQMGSTFEQFHTGEEIDTIYLRLINDGMVKGNFPKKVKKVNVPKRLFFYWDKNMPEDVRENIEHHKRFENYKVDVFDQECASEWLYKYYGREAQSIFLKARHPAEAADILRVHVMNIYGGFWVDADLKIVSEDFLERHIPKNYDSVLLLTKGYFIHNDFFGSVPNNPLLEDCLLSMYRNCYQYDNLFIAYKTGPGIFMRAVNRMYFRCLEGVSKEFPSLQLLNHEVFDKVTEQYPVLYKQGGTWSAV